MKGVSFCIAGILVLGLMLTMAGSAIADEKSLADILREKGILTEEEYQEAVKVEDAQKAQDAEKIEEAARKAAASAEKPSSLPVAGYQKGFFLQTPDGKFKLSLNGYIRGQLRLYENNTSQDNEFKIRHARVSLTGYYGKYFQGRVEGDFSTPSDGKFLKYAYLNYSYFQDAQLRAGQFKAPFSREYLTSSSAIDTIERAMITDSGGTVPKYDIGIMLHGPQVWGGVLNYAVGVFNGNGANNSDTNDDKDLVGRLVSAPFAASNISALKGLEFGGSYQTGRETPTQRYQPKLPTDWAFFKEVNYRGGRDRYGLDMAYKVGPFKLQAEWIYQRLERENQVRVDPDTHEIVSSGGKLIDAPDLISWGWYVLGTYFVWGDANKGIQLVARYEQMDVDDKSAPERYRQANSMGKNSYDNRWGNDLNLRGNTADVLTLGINYFPFPNVKLAFNWYYQTLDNKYTTDKISHANDGSEVVTAKGGAMNAFYLLAQVMW
jgi:phosphate-selective porin